DVSSYAVLRNPDFSRYVIGRFVASLGQQMVVVAIDWELYKRTNSALALAFVGLSQMLPMILCTIPAGHFADTFNRKKIILITTLLLAAASLGLTLSSALLSNVGWIYFFLVIIGAARTFLWPASAAFVTSLVPREQFARAVTFNSGAFQLSCVLGPVIFGAVVALTPHAETRGTAWSVYALNVLASILCFALVAPIKHLHKAKSAEPVSVKSLVEGFRFVHQNKIILGVITLDLFAVLLGGTVAILPIYAQNVFHVGAGGLGWLRNAMSIGAVVCAFIIAHRPPLQKAGKTMLLCVAIFGVATILFGVANKSCFGSLVPNSIWFWLSFAMLALAGFVDNISVVVRQTLVQILTPDEKRGRVSAVNSLFIGTSNELGGFRSGIVAYLFTEPSFLGNAAATGAIVSTVSGGVGTIVVVMAVAWIWPEIRKYGKLA
ncbi:MAG TPA: MFS transporter, partial [Candidatus Baltobacteraceae bacterium]|nr:MFS transporter [Candidatus Baltobacteraceae bacterium]